MRCAAVALVNEGVCVAAARAVEFRPAAAAALFAVNMSFREIGFDVGVEVAVFNIAHFPVFYTHKLVARVNIAVRLDCHIVVSAAAPAKSFNRARTLSQKQKRSL